MPNARRALVVFARAPTPGAVKTRLAADLGDAAALRIYRELGARAVAAACAVPDCVLSIAFTPAAGAEAVREWLGPDVRLRPQADGDLGARMAAAVADALAAGAERVVVVGTDCPDLDAATIESGFDRLDAHDVVLGPAADGGYYLIGLRRLHRELFEGVPWSAADTLERTLERAADAGLRVALLDVKRDIDTAADWAAWVAARPAPTRTAT